jgi:hypothetical protein
VPCESKPEPIKSELVSHLVCLGSIPNTEVGQHVCGAAGAAGAAATEALSAAVTTRLYEDAMKEGSNFQLGALSSCENLKRVAESVQMES